MRTILRCWPAKWRTSIAGKLTMLVLLSLFGTGAFAQTITFSQAANANPTLGNLDWINSILNANNSKIYEGMSTLQRVMVTGMTPTSTQQCMVIKMQAEKAGFHAYDFIGSWQQALDATDVLDGTTGVYPDQTTDPAVNRCQGLQTGGQPPSETQICNTLTETGTNLQVFVTPSAGEDAFTLAGDAAGTNTGTVINQYESTFGTRYVNFWHNGDPLTTTASLTWLKYEAGYIFYTFCWTAPGATAFRLEFAAHVAVGDATGGQAGYGTGRGASNISGGPYHVILDSWTLGGLGAQDNQLQGSNILTAPPECTITGTPSSCSGGTSTFSGPVLPAGGTYAWSFVGSSNGAVFTGAGAAAGGATATGQNVTVTNGTGNYTVQLITTVAGVSSVTPCTYAVTVCPPPAFTGAPGNVTVACSAVPAVPTVSYTNGGAGNCLEAGSVVAVRTGTAGACGGTLTDTWTYVDLCNRTITGSRTITVEAAPAAAFTGAPGNVTVACGAVPAVPTVSYTNGGSGGCLISGSVVAVRTGSAPTCGGTLTDTWTFVDACNRTISGSRTILVNPAPVASFTTPPTNVTVACGAAPAVPTVSYTNGGSGSCLISGSVVAVRTGSAPTCGGTLTDTWTLVDACSRTITGSRTIVVSPAAIASFTAAPGNVTVACGAAPAVPTVSFTNGGSGDCLISGSVVAVRTGTAPTCGGTLTDTWTYVDACNRTISGSRTVVVSPAPVAAFTDGPGNVTVACGAAPAVPTVSYTNGASGGCLISGTVVAVRTGSAPTCGGTLTDTWSFVDACNRTISGSRTIVVNPAPVAAFTGAPVNVTVACGAAPAVPTVSFTNGGSGSCLISGSVTAVRTGSAPTCGGTLTDTWTYVDACNRTISGSRTVVVNPAPVASFTTPPGNITVACSAIPAVPTISYTNGGSGTCLISGSVPAIRTGTAGSCGGVLTDTWTFIDVCNRTISGSRTITVGPTPVAQFTDAPGNITVACGATPGIVTVAYSNGAEGPCLLTGTVIAIRTGSAGSCGGTLTDTWTLVDNCGRTINGTRSVTVLPAAIAAFTGAPGNVTVACGATPAVPTVSFTNGGSGDCLISGSVVAVRTGTAPTCGGTLTDTWTYVDVCNRTISGSRTVVVTPAPVAAFTTPPTNVTVACGAVPAVPTVSYTNGGSGACLISGSVVAVRTGSAPICGGTLTDTWSFVDVCNRTISGSRTIVVSPAAVAAFTGAPGNVTVACGSVPAVPTVSYTNGGSGGCLISGSVTAVRTGSAPVCGGTLTDTWTFIDQCNRTISGSRTIVVSPAAAPAFTGIPANVTVSCGSVPAVPTVSYTNGLTGSCLISGSVVAVRTGSAPICGGTLTDTWTYVDACSRTISGSRTIVVNPAAAPVFTTTPGNTTATACVRPLPSGLDYSNSASGACLISGTVQSVITGEGDCGTFTETWTYVDACNRTITASRSIEVDCCDEVFCTYTQGQYGTAGGMACDGTDNTPNQFSTAQTITNAINAQGGSITIGAASGAKSIVITSSAGDVAKVIEYLPGGGSSYVLTNAAQISISSAAFQSAYTVKKGNKWKINNTLLAQTITLSINMGITPTLSGLSLAGAAGTGAYLVTKETVACGDPTPKTCQWDPVTGLLTYDPNHNTWIDGDVVDYLTNKTVGGLLALANKALAGDTAGFGAANISLSSIAGAVDAINNAFDECMLFIGWSPTKVQCAPIDPNYVPPLVLNRVIISDNPAISKLSVGAYPNPFTDVVKFTIASPVSGMAQLEIYNMMGQKVTSLYNGMIQANRPQVVEHKFSTEAQQNLIYILRVGDQQVTGKLLNVKR